MFELFTKPRWPGFVLTILCLAFVGAVIFAVISTGERSDWLEGYQQGYEYGVAETTRHYEAKIENLDSCLVMCHEQGMYTYNKWRECAQKRVEDLDFMLKASLPDSTVLIDGVLIECANQVNWPSSGGILKEKD